MLLDCEGLDTGGLDAQLRQPLTLSWGATGSFTVKVDRTIPLAWGAEGSFPEMTRAAGIPAMMMDVGGLDCGTPTGVSDPIPAVLVDRTIPLSWEGDAKPADPMVGRTIPLSWGATGAPSLIVDRSIPLSWGAVGGFDDPEIKRIIDLNWGAEGALSIDPLLRLIGLNWGVTGGFPATARRTARIPGMLLDCGLLDCGSEVSTEEPVPAVLVDRTIPLEWGATGTPQVPIFDWILDLIWGATGTPEVPKVDRSIVLNWGATGHFDDITPFIPVHYLDLNWGATGQFTFGFVKTIDLVWGATGHFDDITPFIPVHYLDLNWGATGAPQVPWVYRSIVNIDKLIVAGRISRTLADKMYAATFDFDKTTVAGIYSTLFWTKLVFKIPDYAGNFNTVFVGVAPSSSTNVRSVRYPGFVTGNQQMKAMDYSYFLTAQYVEPRDQVLLKTADQLTDYTYYLQYRDRGAVPFTVGNRVTGKDSGDSGTIVAVTSSLLTLKAVSGSSPYFQDNEELRVAGVRIAYANGRATGPAAITVLYPDDYIRTNLLGGITNWAAVTGIYPYNIASSYSVWGHPEVTGGMPEKEFPFTETTTKAQAIQAICDYMKWIFYVRWRDVSGVGTDIPCAFFVPESAIDTQLYLPDPVYVTATTDYDSRDARKHVVSPFTLTQAGENQYNWITVRCQGLTGAWYQSVQYASDVYDETLNPTGTKPKREYKETNKDICTQADCTARALDLYTYYQKQVCTWKVTFTQRSDLVLLQKLIVSGYSPVLPDGTYRIISVDLDYSKGGTKNTITVSIILDTDFKAYLNLKRVYLNSVYEIQNVVQDALKSSVGSATGIVISRTDSSVMVAIDGANGAVKRTAFDPTSLLAAGDKVMVTIDSHGKLIAVKTA